MVNSHLVCDPTIRQPGFDLPLQQWSLINRFHMKQGHCLACRRRWRLTNTYLCLLVKFIKHNQNYYLKSLTFRTLSEAYIRKSWYSVLPVLDTTERRRVKKAVVCVAQLVAALITVHGLLSFLSDVYGSLIHLVKRSGSLSITVA